MIERSLRYAVNLLVTYLGKDGGGLMGVGIKRAYPAYCKKSRLDNTYCPSLTSSIQAVCAEQPTPDEMTNRHSPEKGSPDG